MNKEERMQFLYDEINYLIDLEVQKHELGMNTKGINERIEKHFIELKSLTNR